MSPTGDKPARSVGPFSGAAGTDGPRPTAPAARRWKHEVRLYWPDRTEGRTG